MTRFFLVGAAAVAVLVTSQTPADAQTSFSCGTGTVRLVEAIAETVTQETVATRRTTEGDIEVVLMRTDTRQRRTFFVTVQLGSTMYTSESAGDPNATLDPMRLAAGDPIDICVNGTLMVLERRGGDDYRAPVVRTAPAADLSRGTR